MDEVKEELDDRSRGQPEHKHRRDDRAHKPRRDQPEHEHRREKEEEQVKEEEEEKEEDPAPGPFDVGDDMFSSTGPLDPESLGKGYVNWGLWTRQDKMDLHEEFKCIISFHQRKQSGPGKKVSVYGPTENLDDALLRAIATLESWASDDSAEAGRLLDAGKGYYDYCYYYYYIYYYYYYYYY
jgi:hypothetical protein